MTKEEWNVIKIKQELPIEVFFEYYLSVGGIVKELEAFTELFMKGCVNTMFALDNSVILCNFDYNTAIKRVYKHFDNQFQ